MRIAAGIAEDGVQPRLVKLRPRNRYSLGKSAALVWCAAYRTRSLSCRTHVIRWDMYYLECGSARMMNQTNKDIYEPIEYYWVDVISSVGSLYTGLSIIQVTTRKRDNCECIAICNLRPTEPCQQWWAVINYFLVNYVIKLLWSSWLQKFN